MSTTHVRCVGLCMALVVGFAACGDDGAGPEGPFTLTFRGDASFHGPHGDQAVAAAVVNAGSGSVVATDQSTVSSSADPAFSFTFADVLESGTAYEVHYWIDSNFGGGTVGECDDVDIDHQWSVDLGTADADVTHTEAHDASVQSAVCGSFD